MITSIKLANFKIEQLEAENARLREELSDREDDIRTEQLWVTHWKEECDKLVHLIALLPSRRSKRNE